MIEYVASFLPVIDRVMLGSTCKSMRNCLLVDSEGNTSNTDSTYKGMTLKEAAHFGNLRQFQRSLHQFQSSPLNAHNQSKVFEAVDILAMNPRLTQAAATFLETEHSYAGVGPYSGVLFKKSLWDAVKTNNVLLLRSLMTHHSTTCVSLRSESLSWGYYLVLAIANDAVDVVEYLLPQRCIDYTSKSKMAVVLNLVIREDKVWAMEMIKEAILLQPRFPEGLEVRSPEMARVVCDVWAIVEPEMIWPLRHDQEEFMSYIRNFNRAHNVYKFANERKDLEVLKMIASKYPWAPAFSGCSIPTHPSMTGVLRIMSLTGDCNDEAGAIMDAEEITDQKLLVELSRLGWCRAVYDRVDLYQRFRLLDKAVTSRNKEVFMVLWEHSQSEFRNEQELFEKINRLPLSKSEFKDLIQQFDEGLWTMKASCGNIDMIGALLDLGVVLEEHIAATVFHKDDPVTIQRMLAKFGY